MSKTVVQDRSQWLKDLKAGDVVKISLNTNVYDRLLDEYIEHYTLGTVVGNDPETIMVNESKTGMLMFFGPRGGRETLKGGKYGDHIIKPYTTEDKKKGKELEKKRNEVRERLRIQEEERTRKEAEEAVVKEKVDEIAMNLCGITSRDYCNQKYQIIKHLQESEIDRLLEFSRTLKRREK